MNQEIFVSFKKTNGGFLSFLSLDNFLGPDQDLEDLSIFASSVYTGSLDNLEKLLEERRKYLNNRIPIPARLIWRIGDEIFTLVDKLSSKKLVIDNTYVHLTRDLNLNRKWLEKVVILRRYISRVDLIPADYSWGWFEKSTKAKIQELLKANGV